MDKAQLLKNLCAMCNEGGGVIIVGARKKGNTLVATGVKFKSEE
jgi:predicted HTH transcriptional regulator